MIGILSSDAWLDDELKYFSDAVELEISKKKTAKRMLFVAFEKHILICAAIMGLTVIPPFVGINRRGFENFDLDHYLWDKGIGYDDSLRISRSYNV